MYMYMYPQWHTLTIVEPIWLILQIISKPHTVHVHVHVHTCTNVHNIHTYSDAYTCTHTHTHTHTCILYSECTSYELVHTFLHTNYYILIMLIPTAYSRMVQYLCH